MKLLTMALTELRFIFRMGISAALIVLSPIIIMALFGTAFSGSFNLDRGFTIAVLDDQPNQTQELLRALRSFPNVTIVTVGSEDELRLKVSQGAVAAGVRLSTENNQQWIRFYVDPEKYGITEKIILRLEGKLAEEKGVIVRRSITGIEQNLGDAAELMQSSITSLDTLSREITQKKKDVEQLREQLTNVRQNPSTGVEKVRKAVASVKAKISEYDRNLAGLELLKKDIHELIVKLNDVDSALNAALIESYGLELARTDAVSNLNSTQNRLSSVDSSLIAIQNSVNTAMTGSNETRTKAALAPVGGIILQARSDLSEAQNSVASSVTGLQSVGVNKTIKNVESARSELSEIRNLLIDAETALGQNITRGHSNAAGAESEILSTEKDIDKLSEFLANQERYADLTISVMDSWNENITASKRNFQEVLDRMRARDKLTDRRALSPVRIDSESVVQNEAMINVFFPTLVGIDLLLASLLLPIVAGVGMKNQGMDFRIRESKLGAANFVLGRFLGNYAISLLQLSIIYAVAFAILDVGGATDYLPVLVVFLLVPAIFAAMGILMSLFVDKESSAILLCVLISISSIFFSGALIPLEAMPYPFDVFGKYMPLTVVKNAIAKTSIKGLALDFVQEEIFLLTVFSLACLSTAITDRSAQQSGSAPPAVTAYSKTKAKN